MNDTVTKCDGNQDDSMIMHVLVLGDILIWLVTDDINTVFLSL